MGFLGMLRCSCSPSLEYGPSQNKRQVFFIICFALHTNFFKKENRHELMIWHPGSDENENPFDCMIDAEDYADMDQVCGTTLFWKKKKSTSLEQDIRTGYQYGN